MDRVRRENPRIVGLRSDFFEQKPKIKISVDRNRAFDLGVSLTEVGRTLETMLGSRIVTTFVERGEEYNVVVQARPEDRATPSDLDNIYVRSAVSRQLIPLANLVTAQETSGPRELKRFNQLRSITLIGGPRAGLLARRCDQVHGEGHRRGTAAGSEHRLRRRVARVPDHGQRHLFHLPAGARRRLPGPRRAVRELPPSADHHGDGATRRDRRPARALALPLLHQRLQPDRLRRC